ncbi:MAG: hypothetical protein OXN44_07615 [Acidimicrobiaceae bacterium]|nr:hypothetical protein [Acidimicrobiaceae bacterium]
MANFTIDQVKDESLAKYRGRVGEIAESEGKEPFDAMIDIAVADDLQTYFMPPTMGTDDETGGCEASSDTTTARSSALRTREPAST